jgi:hypothetical protein
MSSELSSGVTAQRLDAEAFQLEGSRALSLKSSDVTAVAPA